MRSRLKLRKVPRIHGDVVSKHEATIDAIKLSRCLFVQSGSVRVRRVPGGYQVSYMPLVLEAG